MNRYGLEIRAATGSDAALLSEALATAGLTLPPATLAQQIEAIRQSQGGVLLAWEWGPPSGVIAYSRYPSLARSGLTAEVTFLLVTADARRRGVARLLLKAVSQAARQAGCDSLRLVTGDEPSLRAFCEATGFAPCDTVYERPLRKKG